MKWYFILHPTIFLLKFDVWCIQLWQFELYFQISSPGAFNLNIGNVESSIYRTTMCNHFWATMVWITSPLLQLCLMYLLHRYYILHKNSRNNLDIIAVVKRCSTELRSCNRYVEHVKRQTFDRQAKLIHGLQTSPTPAPTPTVKLVADRLLMLGTEAHKHHETQSSELRYRTRSRNGGSTQRNTPRQNKSPYG